MILPEKEIGILEAARLVHMHPESLRYGARQGRLRIRKMSKRIWVVDPRDLQRYLREHRQSDIRELALL
jgi:ribosomal protein L19E